MDRLALAVALALAAASAAAQDRPSEDELFGAPAQQAPPPAQEAPSPTREDALKVGGQLYLRAATTGLQDQDAGDWRLSSPNLLDVYLDVRPNERVRGFALGRLTYDPTILPRDPAAPQAGLLEPATFVQPSSPSRRTSAANPDGALDQLWVNFDVERRAFVTVGRQHAKWGVGRFWNPTDYLHPVRRDPLAVYDIRTGTALVKVHVPWEARGWNLYGVAVLEDLAGDPPRRADGAQDGTNRLGRVGGGGRAEVVLGGVEVGADAMVQDGHRPRFGVDVSTGLWDLDVYAEAALRSTVDTPRWRRVPGALAGADLFSAYERHDPVGFLPQVVAGATYAAKYSDEDVVSFGGEYFYDRSGYEDARVYPLLLLASGLSTAGAELTFPNPGGGGTTTIPNPYAGQPNPFTPFYLGRHYAGAFVSLPSPGRWNDTTFTLSVLGNLSDKSFVARLDHSVLALTYLRVETFVASHFGAREGEFRLGFDVPPQPVPGTTFSLPFRSDPQVFEAGLAVRVSL